MVQIKTYSGGSVGNRDVDASVFAENRPGRPQLLGRTLKDAVVMYEANLRQGTHKAKTRSEVAGGNKKLWKQKHTGRARMGTKKSPLWRGGGVVFGPRPRDYSYKMPVKARRLALKNALFSKFQDSEVAVADGFSGEQPSTKAAFGILKALGMDSSTLVVTAELDRNAYLSLRNIPLVDVMPVSDLNARAVLLRRNLVLPPAALEALQSRFGVGAEAAAGTEETN